MTLPNLPSQSNDIQESGNTFIQLSPHMAVEFIAPADDASDDHAGNTVFPFPDDLVFFYRTTTNPASDMLDDRKLLLKVFENVPVVVVLQVQKSLPIPENWIVTLQRIQENYPQQFSFICIHSVDIPSSAMMYINEKIDCFLELTHTKSFVSHGDLLGASILERIAISSVVSRFQRTTKNEISDVVCDTPAPAAAETPAIVADNVPEAPPAPREPDLSVLPRITKSDLDEWFIHGKPLPR